MRLAAADLPADTATLLHTIPADHRAVLTVNLCNRGPDRVLVSLALTDGSSPLDADWIEYRTPLPAAGSTGGSTMQVTGLALGAGQCLYALSSADQVSAVVHGVQELI